MAEKHRVSFRYTYHHISVYTQCTCFSLVAKAIDNFRGGPNKRDAGLLDLSCEGGVLG